MRDAERELDHLDAALDVALGVADRLAMLARQNVGKFVVVFGDEVEELHQYAGAALRIDRRPSELRRFRVLDRGANLGLGGERDVRAHRAVHRLEDFARSSRLARDVLAADEMPILDHVPLPYHCLLADICATILRTAISENAQRLCENVLSSGQRLRRPIREQSPHDLGIALNRQKQRARWRIGRAPALLPIPQCRDRQMEGLGELSLRHPEALAQRFDARHSAHPRQLLGGERLRVKVGQRGGRDLLVGHGVYPGPIGIPFRKRITTFHGHPRSTGLAHVSWPFGPI